MTRIYKPLLSITAIAMLTACAGTEHTEQVVAEVEAAQMEARAAAGSIVRRNWDHDTVALQHQLLEIRARQSRYILDGHPEQAEAFDSTFLSTVRAVRPELAAKIAPLPDSISGQ